MHIVAAKSVQNSQAVPRISNQSHLHMIALHSQAGTCGAEQNAVTASKRTRAAVHCLQWQLWWSHGRLWHDGCMCNSCLHMEIVSLPFSRELRCLMHHHMLQLSATAGARVQVLSVADHVANKSYHSVRTACSPRASTWESSRQCQ